MEFPEGWQLKRESYQRFGTNTSSNRIQGVFADTIWLKKDSYVYMFETTSEIRVKLSSLKRLVVLTCTMKVQAYLAFGVAAVLLTRRCIEY